MKNCKADEALEESAPEGTVTERDELSISSRLQRLKEMTVQAAEKRTHLPQPLFWSLFNAEIKELKREKDIRRKLKEVLGS